MLKKYIKFLNEQKIDINTLKRCVGKMFLFFKFLYKNSKKLYLTHVLVILFAPITILNMLELPYIIWYMIIRSPEVNDIGWELLFVIYGFLILLILVAIPFQIIAMFIKYKKQRTLFVTNDYLLNNKFYNALYFYSWCLFAFVFLRMT